MKKRAAPAVPAVMLGVAVLPGPIRLTKLIASRPITKRLWLDSAETLQKSSTASNLYEGNINALACSPTEVANVFATIDAHACTTYGVFNNANAVRVLSVAKYNEEGSPADATTRTNDTMSFPSGPAIMMGDYDPADDSLHPQDLLDKLYAVLPALRTTAHIWTASASSCVVDSRTNTVVRSIKGQRVYIVVLDGRDIQRASAVLIKRLWLAGLGYVAVSVSGKLLLRTILDAAVFQPCRIDYCAPAKTEPPLVQHKPPPALHGDEGLCIDTRVALPDLTSEEANRYAELVEAAREAKLPESITKRTAYFAARIDAYVTQGVEVEIAKRTVMDAIDGQVLHADFMLHGELGETVSVGDLLADPLKWDGKHFADPVEPDYHNDHRIATAYLLNAARPHIYSFAHGGQRYELLSARIQIKVRSGERDAYMNAVVEGLLQNADIFHRGETLFAVGEDNQLTEQTEQRMLGTMDRYFRLEHFRKDWKPYDANVADARLLIDAHFRRFPELRAVVSAPNFVPQTGRVIAKAGYDAATGLFARIPEGLPPIPEVPSNEQMDAAVRVLWEPFHLFPFAEPIDEAVAFAAILTTVIRALLPAAPAFLIDAPTQGSGKTLLIKALATLGGFPTAMSAAPDHRNDDEMRKRLFALLRRAKGAIVFDNIVGEFDSASLASLLTSSEWEDRVLGASRAETVSSTALVLMSGNNVTLKGELPRRVLRIRIDPRIERPYQRSFPFDPVDLVSSRRQAMVAAALTLLKAHRIVTGQVRHGPGSTASFEVWDDTVRQTICWLAQVQNGGRISPTDGCCPKLLDPGNAINEAMAMDPRRSQEGRLLDALAASIGIGNKRETTFKTSDLVETVATGQLFIYVDSKTSPIIKDATLLKTVLLEVAGVKQFFINANILGKFLSAMKDRVINGHALRSGGLRGGVQTWWIDRVDGSKPGPTK